MATKQKTHKTGVKKMNNSEYQVVHNDQKEVNIPRAIARIWGLISGISFISNGGYLLTESDRESKKCVISGVLMIIWGLVIIIMECMCCLCAGKTRCCEKIDNSFPFWLKGLIYIISTFPVMILCFGTKTLVSSIMVIFLGIIYLFLACLVRSNRYERLNSLAQQRFREQQIAAKLSYETYSATNNILNTIKPKT
ncbi:calcium channel flower isoform X2 [Hydra vulgaris]|uniref:Calcium channel flower isoform X2 n=1 Tax=Hydra vulgaris TaxID=6087 RepID=A0ABM4BEV4_HYDVU